MSLVSKQLKLIEAAKADLNGFGELRQPLLAIADYIITRTN